jgi:hypothetical protein
MVSTPNRSGFAGKAIVALAASDAALIGLGLILTPTSWDESRYWAAKAYMVGCLAGWTARKQ